MRVVGEFDTCPDCGERVVVAIGALSRELRDYTPRADGNLVLDDECRMVAVDKWNGNAWVPRYETATRFVLHSTVCDPVGAEVGMDALTNWHDRARFDTSEVLA